MTKTQALLQIADALACKTAMLIAQGWTPMSEWARDEASDTMVATFRKEGYLPDVGKFFDETVMRIGIEDVPRLAAEWQKRGNRKQRRAREAERRINRTTKRREV